MELKATNKHLSFWSDPLMCRLSRFNRVKVSESPPILQPLFAEILNYIKYLFHHIIIQLDKANPITYYSWMFILESVKLHNTSSAKQETAKQVYKRVQHALHPSSFPQWSDKSPTWIEILAFEFHAYFLTPPRTNVMNEQ